jgi:hypothetical protein
MGCNASKVPCQVEAHNTRRISTLDFTTSTDFFRTGSSLLLWKPQKRNSSSNNDKTHKISVFEKFRKQQQQQEQKHNDLLGRFVAGPLVISFNDDDDYDELNSNAQNYLTYWDSC